jgi:hypothetical protein
MAIAQRESFAGVRVRPAQHDIRAAEDTGYINMKPAIVPCCRLIRDGVAG